MILLGKNVYLCARRLLPIGNARIKRFILLTADQLGVNGHALELAGQIRRVSRGNSHCQQSRARQNMRFEILHSSPPY